MFDNSFYAHNFQSIIAVALGPIPESIFNFFTILPIHLCKVTVSVIAEAIWLKVGALFPSAVS